MFEIMLLVALYFFGKGGGLGGAIKYKGPHGETWTLTPKRNGPDGHPDSWTVHGTSSDPAMKSFDYYGPTRDVVIQTAKLAIDTGNAGD